MKEEEKADTFVRHFVSQVLENVKSANMQEAVTATLKSTLEISTDTVKRIIDGGRRRAMTHMGGFSLRTEGASHPAIITAGFEVEEAVPLDYLKKVLQEKVLSNDKFYRYSSIIEKNHFVPVHVNIDDHVHVRQVDTEDVKDEESALRDLISDIVSRPLRTDIPLWEIVVIENYSRSFIVLWRIHHVIGDGTSSAMACLSLCDGDPVGKMLSQIKSKADNVVTPPTINTTDPSSSKPQQLNHPVKEQQKKSIVSDVIAFGKNWTRIVAKLIQQFAFYFILLVGLMRISFKWIWESLVIGLDPTTVIKDHTVKLNSNRRVAYSNNYLSVADAKKIGRKFNSTVNDVMLTCLAGAIDRYTLKKKESLYKRVDIRVTTPVNIRTSLKHFDSPSNMFGFMISRLPLGISNTEERLKYVTREMTYNKSLPERYFSYLAAWLFLKILPSNILNRFYQYMANFQSIIATNVQTLDEPVYINGSKLKAVLPFTPFPYGVALGVMILSYNSYLTVSFTSSEAMIPDPEVLLECFLQEFNEMKAQTKSH